MTYPENQKIKQSKSDSSVDLDTSSISSLPYELYDVFPIDHTSDNSSLDTNSTLLNCSNNLLTLGTFKMFLSLGILLAFQL